MRPVKVIQKVAVTSESSVHNGMWMMEALGASESNQKDFFSWQLLALEHSWG
jgi:hypothetical protein